MIYTKLVQRPSQPNLDNISGQPHIPAAAWFRLVPVSPPPGQSGGNGNYPVVCVRTDGEGSPILVYEPAVHRIAKGTRLAMLGGTVGGASDWWLLQYSDDEADEVVPAPYSVNGAPAPSRTALLASVLTGISSPAAFSTPIFDATAVRELSLAIALNVTTGGWRDLSLLQYADDGVTLLSTVLLRRIFGNVPVELLFGQGGLGSFSTILYDFLAGFNTAQDTGIITTQDSDALFASLVCSGGAGTSQLLPYGDDAQGSGGFVQRAIPPAVAVAQFCDWCPGAAVATGMVAQAMAIAGIPPAQARFTCPSAGASTTTHLKVMAKGRPQGLAAMPYLPGGKIQFQCSIVGGASDSGGNIIKVWGR